MYGMKCCTTIQLGVTIEPTNFDFPRKNTSNMGMISCAEMQLYALYLEQLLPKIACESWVAIRNNRVYHAMKLEDLIHEYLSHRGCCKRVLKGAEMSVLGKVINNHHDDRFISRFG